MAIINNYNLNGKIGTYNTETKTFVPNTEIKESTNVSLSNGDSVTIDAKQIINIKENGSGINILEKLSASKTLNNKRENLLINAYKYVVSSGVGTFQKEDGTVLISPKIQETCIIDTKLDGIFNILTVSGNNITSVNKDGVSLDGEFLINGIYAIEYTKNKEIILTSKLVSGDVNVTTDGSKAIYDGQHSTTYGAANVFDVTKTRNWYSAYTLRPHYIGYDFGIGNEKIITKIKYKTNASYAPKHFIIQASNDNVNYVDLFEEQNGVNTGNTLKEINFTNIVSYRYYKMKILTTGVNNNYARIDVMEMYEAVRVTYNKPSTIASFKGFSSTLWSSINSIFIRDNGLVYYTMSFDTPVQGQTFNVFDGNGRRPVASNDISICGGNGVWRYRDNVDLWINAPFDDCCTAISEATKSINNQMTSTILNGVTKAQWNGLGGFAEHQTRIDMTATLNGGTSKVTDAVFDVDKIGYKQADLKSFKIEYQGNKITISKIGEGVSNLIIEYIK